MTASEDRFNSPIDLSETDIVEAMKDIQGYIDISPGDFREIFQMAYRHALERLVESRTGADIMTSPVHQVTLGTDLRQAAAFLAAQGISGAPVVDPQGRLAGVVSEKDFLVKMGLGKTASFMQIIAHCLNNKGCVATLLRNHRVEEIMTTPAISAGPEITVGVISALFIDRQINRLPLVDTEGRLLGIVTRTDLLHAYRLSR